MDKVALISKIAGDFKLLKRSGWVQHGSARNESIADHTWGLSFLVMIYTPKHLDKLKCLELATIHDLPEIIAGDITPFDNVSPDEKTRREMAAMETISERLNEPYFMELFNELEEQKTAEGQFIKQLDKIEVMLQAHYFVTNGYMKPTVYQEYYNTSKSKIHLPYLIDLFNKLVKDYKDISIKS